jgi:hypothetical protein
MDLVRKRYHDGQSEPAAAPLVVFAEPWLEGSIIGDLYMKTV